jgi:hypothetical protein
MITTTNAHQARFTRAPWEDNGNGLIYGQVCGDDDEAPFVADVCRDGAGGFYSDEEQANARLITSAPELYGAAKAPDVDAAHDVLSKLLEDPDAGNDEIREAAIDLCCVLDSHHEARTAALAKAEGRWA